MAISFGMRPKGWPNMKVEWNLVTVSDKDKVDFKKRGWLRSKTEK
jgi:hypothetical protein